MATDTFAFVLNPFHYAGDLPIELSPGVYLHHATNAQKEIIERFREELGLIGKSMILSFEPILDESDRDRLLQARTTFWVINFSGDSQPIWELSHAAQLTDSELEVAAIFPPESSFRPREINQWRVFYFCSERWGRYNAQPLDYSDVILAGWLAGKLREFGLVDKNENSKRAVVRAFDDFVSLSREHRSGHLALLGHFALIEALVTHDPAKSGMSLTHQLRTKMPLLMRRFARPLLVSEYFDLGDVRKAWELLYDVRSRYAHGEEPDFEKASKNKGVKKLRDPRSVFRFVRESLKRLIVLALEEPQLIYDLKSC